MCNRGERPKDPETLRTNFSLVFKESLVWDRETHVAPTEATAIVRFEKGARTMVMVRWGLIPSWWSRPLKELPLISNARAETLKEKPAFRNLLPRRRAIMPLDMFYEWKRAGATKQQYAFALKTRDTMGVAALWDAWTCPDTGEVIESAATITTEPNALVAEVHDRMPAILARADFDEWLDPSASIDAALSLLGPYPASEMESWPVARNARRAAVAPAEDELRLF